VQPLPQVWQRPALTWLSRAGPRPKRPPAQLPPPQRRQAAGAWKRRPARRCQSCPRPFSLLL